MAVHLGALKLERGETGRLVHDVERSSLESLYTLAGRDNSSGEIILKVVNPDAAAVSASIELAGVGKVGSRAEATVLAGHGPADENSLDQPTRGRIVIAQLR